MAEARVFQPPPSSLRQKLAAAGGLSLQQLAERVEATLAATDSESPIDKGLRQMVQKLVELGRDPSDAERRTFTAAVSALIGGAGLMGRKPLASACQALMALLETMRGKPWDLPPVSVHIATIQFFAAEPELADDEVEELMEGLREVYGNYQAGLSNNH